MNTLGDKGMLKKIDLAGSVRTPFGSCAAYWRMSSAAKLGEAAVERSGLKPDDVKEVLVGNILSGALRRNAMRQTGIAAGLRWQRNENRNGP